MIKIMISFKLKLKEVGISQETWVLIYNRMHRKYKEVIGKNAHMPLPSLMR